MHLKFIILICCGVCFLSSCSTDHVKQDGIEQELIFQKTDFQNLPGWVIEEYKYFADAFSKSCNVLQKKSAPYFKQGSQWGDIKTWKLRCKEFAAVETQNYRSFFETYFTPYAIHNESEKTGLFTGYYESSLNGSRAQQGQYQYPLYARPDDLVMVQLGDFRDDLKGRRIAGRIESGRLRPFESREEIVDGDIQAAPLVWLNDPVDAFFVQIQGSGMVSLDDGSVMRIGYAGQNGHPYYAIGKILIERGEIKKEDVSLQSIRQWLLDNPDQANEVMNTNASYVFFRELKTDGPVGGQGVPLTKTRSLAIDHTLIPYGVPLWVDIEYPEKTYANIQRLMVAQDTGGAIRGPVRGDFFWGHGDFAESKAGTMKSQGRYWALIPNSSE